MNPRAVLLALAGLALVFAAYLLILSSDPDPQSEDAPEDVLPSFAEETEIQNNAVAGEESDRLEVGATFSFFEPGDIVEDETRPRLLRHYGSETRTGSDDLRLVRGVLEHFWRASGDPDQLALGSNREVLNGLTGANSLGVEFVAKDNRFLDTNGQLLDRWGSPLFFHANSVTDVEIRSSGPDRIRYTEDDIVSRATSSMRLIR